MPSTLTPEDLQVLKHYGVNESNISDKSINTQRINELKGLFRNPANMTFNQEELFAFLACADLDVFLYQYTENFIEKKFPLIEQEKRKLINKLKPHSQNPHFINNKKVLFFRAIILSRLLTKLTADQWFEMLTAEKSAINVFGVENFMTFLHQNSFEQTHEPSANQWTQLLTSSHTIPNIQGLKKYTDFLKHTMIPFQRWIALLISPSPSHHAFLKQNIPTLKRLNINDPICLDEILVCPHSYQNLTLVNDNSFFLWAINPPASQWKKVIVSPFFTRNINKATLLFDRIQKTSHRTSNQEGWINILTSSHTLQNMGHLEPYLNRLCDINPPLEAWGVALTSLPHPQKHIELLKQAHPLLNRYADNSSAHWQTLFDCPGCIKNLTKLEKESALHKLLNALSLAQLSTVITVEVSKPTIEAVVTLLAYEEQLQFTTEAWCTLLVSEYTAQNVEDLSAYLDVLTTEAISSAQWIEALTSVPSDQKHIDLLKQGHPILEPFHSNTPHYQVIFNRPHVLANLTRLENEILAPINQQARMVFQANEVSLDQLLTFVSSDVAIDTFSQYKDTLRFNREEWIQLLTSNQLLNNIKDLKKYILFLSALNLSQQAWLGALTSAYATHKHIGLLKDAFPKLNHYSYTQNWQIIFDCPQSIEQLRILHQESDLLTPTNPLTFKQLCCIVTSIFLKQNMVALASLPTDLNFDNEQLSIVLASEYAAQNIGSVNGYFFALQTFDISQEVWLKTFISEPHPRKHVEVLKDELCVDYPQDQQSSDAENAYFDSIFDSENKQLKLKGLLNQYSTLSRIKPKLNLSELLSLLDIEACEDNLLILEAFPIVFRFDKDYIFELLRSQSKMNRLRDLSKHEHVSFLIMLIRKLQVRQFDTILDSPYTLTNLSVLIDFLKNLGFFKIFEAKEFTNEQLLNMIISPYIAYHIAKILPYIAFFSDLQPKPDTLFGIITAPPSEDEDSNLLLLNAHMKMDFRFDSLQSSQVFASTRASTKFKQLDKKWISTYIKGPAYISPDEWVEYFLKQSTTENNSKKRHIDNSNTSIKKARTKDTIQKNHTITLPEVESSLAPMMSVLPDADLEPERCDELDVLFVGDSTNNLSPFFKQNKDAVTFLATYYKHHLNFDSNDWSQLLASEHTAQNIKALKSYLPTLCVFDISREAWLEALISPPEFKKHIRLIKDMLCIDYPHDQASSSYEDNQIDSIFYYKNKPLKLKRLISQRETLSRFKPKLNLTDFLTLLDIDACDDKLSILELFPIIFRFDKDYIIKVLGSKHKINNLKKLYEGENVNFLSILGIKKLKNEQFDTLIDSQYAFANLIPLINFLQKLNFLNALDTREFTDEQLVNMIVSSDIAYHIQNISPYLNFFSVLRPTPKTVYETIVTPSKNNTNSNLLLLNNHLDMAFEFDDSQCQRVFSSKHAPYNFKNLNKESISDYLSYQIFRGKTVPSEYWVEIILRPVAHLQSKDLTVTSTSSSSTIAGLPRKKSKNNAELSLSEARDLVGETPINTTEQPATEVKKRGRPPKNLAVNAKQSSAKKSHKAARLPKQFDEKSLATRSQTSIQSINIEELDAFNIFGADEFDADDLVYVELEPSHGVTSQNAVLSLTTMPLERGGPSPVFGDDIEQYALISGSPDESSQKLNSESEESHELDDMYGGLDDIDITIFHTPNSTANMRFPLFNADIFTSKECDLDNLPQNSYNKEQKNTSLLKRSIGDRGSPYFFVPAEDSDDNKSGNSSSNNNNSNNKINKNG